MKLVKQLTYDLHIKIALKPLQLLAFKNEVGKIVDTVQIQYRQVQIYRSIVVVINKENEELKRVPEWELVKRITTKE